MLGLLTNTYHTSLCVHNGHQLRFFKLNKPMHYYICGFLIRNKCQFVHNTWVFDVPLAVIMIIILLFDFFF